MKKLSFCTAGFGKQREDDDDSRSERNRKVNDKEQQRKRLSEEEESIRHGKELEMNEVVQQPKREKATKNLLTIPPSRISKTVFSIQNPFIKIIDGSVSFKNMEDKVRDGRVMDDAALKAAIFAMQSKSDFHRRVFKTPSSELGARPHHIALAGAFWLLTKPSPPKTYDSVFDWEKAEAISNDDEELHHNEEEAPEDLEISHQQVMSGESVESLDVKLEGDEGETGEEKIKYDFNFVVYDKKLKVSDKRVSTLIVDATWNDLSINKMCQVASYGCKCAIRNMEKGRFSPLYLELWGELGWRYGILYMEGVVVVENGEVVAAVYTSSSIESLKRTLESKRREHKDAIGSHAHPDGTYVKGWLYLPNEKFSLPNVGQASIEDIQLFYMSKIRMIAGDSALGWKVKDVEERVAGRVAASSFAAEDLERKWVAVSENKRVKNG